MFTTVVVLSLALAIALNTTMYSVLDALAHPRIDLRDPGQLYWIRFYGDYKRRVTFAERDSALQSAMHSYEAVTRAEGIRTSGLFEHGQNYAEGMLEAVGANFFDVMGPRVLAGRAFLPSDVDGGAEPIVLRENIAAVLFPNGASPIGQAVTINWKPHVVIGVISAASYFPNDRTAAWTPVAAATRGTYSRLVRLRHGESPQSADRELRLIADRIALAAGEAPRDVAFRFTQAADPEFQVRGFDWALILAVAAVLLVACANLANLQLARGLTRRRDLTLRAALGATRRRLVGHLLTESVILAAGGLVAGLLLTFLSGRLLHATIPPSVGRYVVTPQMSWRVLVFAVVATLVCLLLTGLLPSWFVSRADPSEMLKAGAGTGATKGNRNRYGVLVCAEIALALALTSGAAVMVRTAFLLQEFGFGFDPRPLTTGFVGFGARPHAAEPYSAALQSLAARIRTIGGVADAATSVGIPVLGNAVTVGDAGGVREELVGAYAALAVSPGFFRTLNQPIVNGRDFPEGGRDVAEVIVDEQTAHFLWPNANPIGAQLKLGDAKSTLPYVRVVGVVGQPPGFEGDAALRAAIRGTRTIGRIYYLPGPSDIRPAKSYGPFEFVARAAGNPERLPIAIRRALLASSDLTGYRVMSMDESAGLSASRSSARFTASLFSLFAVLGLGLALFGVYGVVAHTVTERRRELGVRIALGASTRDILHAVLRESVIVALGGVAVGLLCIQRVEQHLPFGSGDPFDVVVYALVALALVGCAAVAALVPAMRATRVDPTESLRND